VSPQSDTKTLNIQKQYPIIKRGETRMNKEIQELLQTITHIEINNQAQIISIKGRCKAKDLRRTKK
jgi:hypothetical protein